MAWVIETAIDWVWTDLICAIYKRYGLIAAALAIFGPLVIIGLLVTLLCWV